MYNNKYYLFTVFLLVSLLGFLSYQILTPFLTAFGWAIVFGIVFYPVYLFIRRVIRNDSVASIITILGIILLIVGPLSYFSVLIGSEIASVIDFLNKEGPRYVNDIFSLKAVKWLIKTFNLDIGPQDITLDESTLNKLSKFGSSLVDRLSIGLTSILSAFFNFVFVIVCLFFFFIDGAKFVNRIHDYLPFAEKHKNTLTRQIRDMVISTIYGGVVVSLLQGIIGGITLFLLSVEAPVLWGMAMSVMSFVPMLGTFGVWGPICIYLIFIKHEVMKGIILLLVGTFIISMVDNILKPKIISGRTNLSMFLVFFSVLGGMKYFGLIGLIMGPLVIVLFLSIFEIFRSIEQEGRGDYRASIYRFKYRYKQRQRIQSSKLKAD